MSENREIELLIAIPIYFILLLCCAYVGYQRTNHAKSLVRAQGHEEDVVDAHYLGGRNFGPIVTAGSMYASIFSGYTLVGVPNEAFYSGFLSSRWILAVALIIISMMVTGARLRKIGLIRKHQSPVDFIKDRFRSNVLRYTILVLMFLPALIFLTGQLVAIRSTFNALFDIPPSSPVAVLIISALLLVFEWVGGLNSVALTDCVQVAIMIVCFIGLPIVVSRNFVGWSDIDWETYPRQDFYQTPSTKEAWDFWNFGAIFFSAFAMPHIMQRVYAAESFAALKAGYAFVLTANWLNMISGIFLGTVGVQVLFDLGLSDDEISSPFGSMLEAVIDLGGFPKVIGVVASTAALAAIMSTADSILIAMSHLLTSEVLKPFFPNASGVQLTTLGRLSSLVSMIAALFISFYAGQGISQLASIQYSVQMQMIPAFFLGLFASEKWECHPWTLAFSGIAGAITTTTISFVADNESVWKFGMNGIIVNVMVLFVLESARRINRRRNSIADTASAPMTEEDLIRLPKWDRPDVTRFNPKDNEESKLTPNLISAAMDDLDKSLVEKPWFALLVLALSVLSSPFTESGTPPMGDDGKLLWEPNLVGGIPSWAFRIIVVGMVPLTFVGLWAVKEMPSTLLKDKDEEEVVSHHFGVHQHIEK